MPIFNNDILIINSIFILYKLQVKPVLYYYYFIIISVANILQHVYNNVNQFSNFEKKVVKMIQLKSSIHSILNMCQHKPYDCIAEKIHNNNEFYETSLRSNKKNTIIIFFFLPTKLTYIFTENHITSDVLSRFMLLFIFLKLSTKN